MQGHISVACDSHYRQGAKGGKNWALWPESATALWKVFRSCNMDDYVVE